MEKTEKRTPMEIAKDLETIDFAEIDENDLQEVFGGTISGPSETNLFCPIC